MKKVFLPFLLLVSSVLAGELQTLHAKLAEAAPAPKQAQAPSIPGVAVLPGSAGLQPETTDISEIGIERLRCYAGCPAYTFIVNADGTFRYTGDYGVERLGDYTGTVSVGRLNQVLRAIDNIGFTAFQDTYRAEFLDGPTVYTMVVKNGDTKVIENYGNSGPGALWAVEQLIDSLLETADWEAGGDTR